MSARANIRRANAADLPRLIHLWRELIGFDEALGGQDFRLAAGAKDEWERHLRAHVRGPRRTAFLAESAGRAVGFLLASLERPAGIFMEREYGLISAAYVEESLRGKGVGSALVEAAFDWFTEKRASRVRVSTDAKNALGVEFWKHHGFAPTVVTMDRLL
jgi:GNAT superfamily N-acetyltransferase